MSIPDPHAIPETEHDVHEYVTEADGAWDTGDSERAYALYHAVFQSHFAAEDQRSVAAYRCGLTKLNEGDTDTAHAFLSASAEPGAHDALHAMNNATHNDPTPSPDQVPLTQEQFDAWMAAGLVAENAGNWELALGLYSAASQATAVVSLEDMAMAYGSVGFAEHRLGHDDLARQYIEWAIPNLADGDTKTRLAALGLVKKFGGAHETAADQSPASAQVAAGIQAYENGDAHAARTALEAALHLDGPDDQKGRARYYLGAMDYQEHRYADARNHIEAAAATAPDLERGWAEAALNWRWDEHPAQQ